MTDDERITWWQDASKGFFPWQSAFQKGEGMFVMWVWMATTAYLWNAGFQQLAATHQGFRADWNTAGFTLPVLILLVLGSMTLIFNSRTTGKVLAALSLFLIHIFLNNLATLAAWEFLDLDPKVVTPQSMLIEIATAAANALPLVPSTIPSGMPLAAAIVLFPLRNTPPKRLNVYLPLAAFLLWTLLACKGFYLT